MIRVMILSRRSHVETMCRSRLEQSRATMLGSGVGLGGEEHSDGGGVIDIGNPSEPWTAHLQPSTATLG
jgi:hypothetical protein